MTWLLGPVTVRNNVIGLPTSSASCVLCVEDYSHQRTAAQMGVTSNGNVLQPRKLRLDHLAHRVEPRLDQRYLSVYTTLSGAPLRHGPGRHQPRL